MGKVDHVNVVDQMNTEGEQPVSVRRKRPKLKKRYVLIGILLFLFLVGSVFSVIGYRTYDTRYHNDLALAQTGAQHLRKAESLLAAYQKNLFDDRPVNQAQQEFSAAIPIFVQLNTELKSLPGISTSLPVYGARLNAALHLLPIAIEASQAGLVACRTLNLLISRFHNPVSGKGQDLTMADLAVVNQNFQQIKTVFNLIVDQVSHLQPADLQLDPRLSKLLDTFHREIPTLQTWLGTAEKLLPVIPTLLGVGTPTNYLVEVLDSSELRPGGGFIGNYGIVTVSGGRLASAHLTDTYLLDNAFKATGRSIPFPAAYTWFDQSPGGWSLRDSNLDADFQTDARNAEHLYTQEGGVIPVQGVIAITPALIQRALEITGPISVPEYHETVTSQNLVDRIHYYQLVADDRSSVRKHFTALLAEHFLARVHQLPSSEVSKFIQLLVKGMQSKDIQIYLNQSVAENLLHLLHLDGAIQQSDGDGIFVVDANIASDKANSFITNTLNDQVVIDARGNATHHTTLSYAWAIEGKLYGSPLYRDYVRVYVPPGSILNTQDGWQPRGTSMAFGREVWAGFFTLSYGQTDTITLTWTVPGVARKGANGWHYSDALQRQAGSPLWKLDLQVTLPPCAVINNKEGGLVSTSKREARLNQLLNKDINVGLDYAC